VPWQEFKRQTGRADGDLVEEDLHPPTRFCEPDLGPQRRHPRDDDDPDHEHKKPRDRSFIRRMYGCMEDRGRSRDRGAPAQRTNRGWLQGGSSHGRTRGNMPHASPQGRGSLAHDEKRALEKLWNDKEFNHQAASSEHPIRQSEAIVIQLQEETVFQQGIQGLDPATEQPSWQDSAVIVIHPQQDWSQPCQGPNMQNTGKQGNKEIPSNAGQPHQEQSRAAASLLNHNQARNNQMVATPEHTENQVSPATPVGQAPQPPISPTSMDQGSREQGQQIQQILSLFKQTTTAPLSGFVLQTPLHKSGMPKSKGKEHLKEPISKVKEQLKESPIRQSPRLKHKNSDGKTTTKLDQDLLAKKCGILEEDQEMDTMTLQQYLDMYKQPLSAKTMDAINNLTEVAVDKAKKKKKKQKESCRKNKQEKLEAAKTKKANKFKKKERAPVGGLA
jgi:hypothetical protein